MTHFMDRCAPKGPARKKTDHLSFLARTPPMFRMLEPASDRQRRKNGRRAPKRTTHMKVLSQRPLERTMKGEIRGPSQLKFALKAKPVPRLARTRRASKQTELVALKRASVGGSPRVVKAAKASSTRVRRRSSEAECPRSLFEHTIVPKHDQERAAEGRSSVRKGMWGALRRRK
jgi:hypothetical protein